MCKMASIEKIEIWFKVKFCQQNLMGDTPTSTNEKVRMTKGKKSCSRTHVFEWYKHFRDREDSLADNDGPDGREKLTRLS